MKRFGRNREVGMRSREHGGGGDCLSRIETDKEIVISVLHLFDSDVENDSEAESTTSTIKEMGSDDFDSLSVTDSGVFSDNDACSSGRSSPVSCKEGLLSGRDDRFAILTFDQLKRIDSVLNEVVALEGRGNFPAIEVKLKDLLIAVKEKLQKEGLKIRDIRLNGGAASHALNPEPEPCYDCGLSYQSRGEDGLVCSCHVTYDSTASVSGAVSPAPSSSSSLGNGSASNSTKTQSPPSFVHSPTPTATAITPGLIKSNASFSYNDIDLIFGIELSTAKHFDRVKTAVLDVILDLLPPQVSRTRMSSCALKEAYVSKMVKVCDGDRWSLIALGNCQNNSFSPPTSSTSSDSGGTKGSRSCSVELKFVDTMRRQYEFSVDSFQIILDSLLLFYKCAAVPMTGRFFPTVIGESVYGDFNEALFHLHQGLIATHNPEEIRGGGLLKFCNLIVRGYRPADVHSIVPLQRYMCSRFFIDFPDIEQQEIKLRTFVVNHMSGVSGRLRYAFLVTLHNVVDSSTVCLMGHERRLTLQLIQRLAYQLYASDFQAGICGADVYPATCYYMPPQYNHLSSISSSSACSSKKPSYQPHLQQHGWSGEGFRKKKN